MATVTIRTDPLVAKPAQFLARSGNRQAVGRTAGEVLDALASQWGTVTETLPVLIQPFGPDPFFTQAQYDRMQELRSRMGTLSTEEWAELEGLIDAEIEATLSRLK